MCTEEKEKIKIILLKLLDSQEVKQKIRTILSQEENCFVSPADKVSVNEKKYSEHISQMQHELEILKQEKESFEKHNSMLHAEINQKDDELRKVTDKLKDSSSQCARLLKEKEEIDNSRSKLQKEMEEFEANCSQQIKVKENEARKLLADIEKKNLQIDDMKEKILNLSQEVQNITETLNSCINEKQALNDSLKQSADTIVAQKRKITDTEKKLNNLQLVIEPFQSIYSEYQKLPETIKQNLSGIFACKTMWDFVFCGTREDILPSLWDQWQFVQQQNPKACGSMEKIFMFFFNQVNRLHESPDYELIVPEIGCDFDDDVASRDHSSNAQGRIDRILLPGFSYISNGKVVRKPRVHVK